MGIRGVCRGAKPEIAPLSAGLGDGWQPSHMGGLPP